jgi:hypothetical protein
MEMSVTLVSSSLPLVKGGIAEGGIVGRGIAEGGLVLCNSRGQMRLINGRKGGRLPQMMPVSSSMDDHMAAPTLSNVGSNASTFSVDLYGIGK